MFIPDGSSSQLNFPSSSECVNSVISNREHTVVAVLTDTSIYFYLADSCLLACVFRREEEDIRERGLSRKAYWKPDSTAICVTTANNFLNIYSVEIAQSPSSFNLHDPVGEFARKSSEFFLAQKRPQINVNLAVVAKLESPTACLLSFKEDLILCLKDGWLHRLTWAGVVLQELSFNIRSITADHHPHRNSMSGLPQKAAPAPTKFVADIAPFLGGIAAVLNHGRALLLLSNTTNFQPDSITVLWAHGLADACCCTANFKFRLIYFGCKNGDIAGYSIDDMNGELVQLFRIHLAIKNGIEYLERLSSVCQISCLIPNGTAFAVIWSLVDKQEEEETDDGEKLAAVVNGAPHENGESVQSNKKFCPPTLAIFSPFGEQWWCSLEDNAGIADYQGPSSASSPPFYTGLDWTVEGYQLWLGTSGAGLQLLNLIRSIPCVHDQLMMAGADRLYLCPSSDQLISDNQQMNATAPRLVWQLLKPPHNYIASNWPIKHIALGQSPDKVVAVGGSHGFCFYNFKVAKWRMFRKEAQEKSLLLTGGLALVDEFIVCSACNLETKVDDSDRLYVFKMKEQLDLDLAQSTPTSRVLIMQMSESYLLTFDVNSVVSIYTISKKPGSRGRKQTSEVELECDVEIRIAEFMPHPNCLIAMELAKLNFHADAMPFCHGMDSLLVNIAGHLLLLSPMKTQFNGQDKNKVEDNVTEFQFHPPTLVASFVEDFWIIHPPSVHQQQQTLENGNGKIPYLSEAIWINAGCKKSRIWLPLSLEMQKKQKSPTAGAEKKKSKSQLVQQNSRTFISRRIMLPFSMDIYPLFINSNYLACGVNCTSTQLKSTGGGTKLVADNVSLTSKLTEDDSSVSDSNAAASSDDRESGPAAAISVYSVVQTTEVFIHKLLKQLLKRNLGSYAFELATECRSLPYFGHILELLLHDLLEEEATSSEPIPDPLLPTVVSFLHEFPDEYLQTIVHCARKTELAYWKLLFSASHHPRQLFQMCIREGRLETATSCLIILQSLVGIHESSKYAYQLLEKALTRRRWDIAQDIIRFMQNINRASERDGLIDGLIAGLRESPFFRGM